MRHTSTSTSKNYGHLSCQHHVVLGLEEVNRLVRTVTDELGTCGLTTPFLFSSLARSSRVRRLIVVFTKYDTMLVTPIIHRAPRGGSTEQVWQNAEREANKVFEVLCIGPFTKAIDEVLSKKVPNANLSVPI